MKALTIWQPWASLIVWGAKPYEFRRWRPPASLIGQQIVIHAGARKPSPREVDQLRRLLGGGRRFAAATALAPPERALEVLSWGEWPLSAGLGTAFVGAPKSAADIGREIGAINMAVASEHELDRMWGWPMIAVDRWETPFRIKGAQGLWTWPDASEWAA